MSFNIRSFNRFRWLDKENIPGSIAAFIKQVSPDVICFQEFAEDLSPEFEDYPFKVFKPYVVDGHKLIYNFKISIVELKSNIIRKIFKWWYAE